ncbi:MAG TPA: M13 family metallopeptidase [Terriglobales bacterium]|nr:M13 family metallopeptidase [Terriglobales bacterium]
MRYLLALLALLLCSVAAVAENPKGIEVGDINKSADPCTDFFEYSNGKWRAENPIPPSMVRWSRRWASGELAKDQLHVILDDISARKDWPKGSVEQLIGDHYASCMDEARVNQLGVTPIKPLLAEIEKLKNSADLQRMIVRFHQMDIAIPFGMTGESDNHAPTNVIANLYASGLGLPDRDYYVKTEPRFKEAREKYLAHVEKMFTLAGTKPAEAAANAKTVMAMETRLAEYSLDNVALRDPKNTDHKTTFAELKTMVPSFDWTAYFKNANVAPGDLNIYEPKFMAEFNRQLTETTLADWKIYLKWHLLNSAAPSLSKEFVDEDFAFNRAYLAGAREMKPRWKRCVESTDELLGEALGQKYVEKHFPPAAKARMQELVKNLLWAMGDTIKGLTWMSADTKKKALEKLSTFNPKIGYPDKWKDYSSVTVARNDFWSNVVAGEQFNVNDNWSTIGKPVDRGRWGMTPPTSNAYYNPLLNEIVFPAGILQPPSFSMDVIDAVNYGAIGVVIGHEISHGFDDMGAQYAADGRLLNWWTDADYQQFQQRGACIVNQFEGYFIEPGIHHNGKLVLGESIGDLAGAKIAYKAFKHSLEGKPPAPTVDGFTPDQQFFIAWGQFRGDAIRPETQRLMVQSDPHPTGKYRVIGPLSNMLEFQQAFSCKPDSPMVRPENLRCEVW